jgi:hypothetical protein
MTVQELIDLLRECDPDAVVTIIHQPSYPFEYSLQGIAIRADFARADADTLDPDERAQLDDDDYGTHTLAWGEHPKRGTDVVLVEGEQLSYASRAAWDAARCW